MSRLKPQQKKRLIFDILLIVIVNAGFWLFFRERALLDELHAYGLAHPKYQLELLIPLIFMLLVSVLYFVVRRWREGAKLAAFAERRGSRDALTKLYNRQALESKLLSEWDRFSRYKEPFCLILIDIDDFKVINRTFGYHEGDRILIDISEQLVKATRKTDFCARWGGTEFLIFCPVSELQSIGVLAERLRADIYRLLKGGVELSVSLGVSQAGTQKSLEALIKSTELALYKAKGTGGNCVVSL
ncbi:MAG: diguanylate cyclase (GGDEF)-like protein [Psychromonas sp.]|jgi:diguanylate cyclase (GGDEF)-like protein|uniref:GGDEF domain-containing protein n=1 Tax=Psychromonas sp. TaxID=1884585 RepID=UPI0039E504FD